MLAVLVLALVLVPAALAGKGGNGGKPSGGTSTISPPLEVNDLNGDRSPNWGDTVTFDVSTTATDRPYVSLNCYQNGVWVYSASAGFFPDYPWGQNFTLATSSTWTSGAGDCTATLYKTTDGRRSTTLATRTFHVNA